MRLDGEWREARNPTEEIRGNRRTVQKVGCGEHADKTYVEVLAKGPNMRSI